MGTLRKYNVFIDTSIFYTNNFDFGGRVTNKLIESVRNGSTQLLTTVITFNEIKSNITSLIENSLSTIKNMRKSESLKILKSVKSPKVEEFFEKTYLSNSEEIMVKQFEDFIKQSETNYIHVNEVSIDKVFHSYFNKLPPFGQGKKKDEFPDAFVIEALEKWCLENKDKIFVVSSDSDMYEACIQSGNLQCLSKIEELFDILTKDEALYTLVSELVSNNENIIKEGIEEEFGSIAFWIDDKDGDVNSVEVNRIEFTGNPLIINIEDDIATIYQSAYVDFSAEVSYKDYDNAIYDKEEGKYLFLESVYEDINRREKVEIEFKFKFSTQDDSFFDIDSIRINDNTDFSLSIDDN